MEVPTPPDLMLRKPQAQRVLTVLTGGEEDRVLNGNDKCPIELHIACYVHPIRRSKASTRGLCSVALNRAPEQLWCPLAMVGGFQVQAIVEVGVSLGRCIRSMVMNLKERFMPPHSPDRVRVSSRLKFDRAVNAQHLIDHLRKIDC